ncbi:hypothetical protein GH714_022834 [Hevea brasiliensis]|uniref:Terpene synthase N-terminal domain-containing protein n=1 Tax=Hevea brasiliensis TaxID=3981 RepID=A0A6A6LBC3_HEVBR|nr:hypothetical protein GH714_022834 [Hevea brasiliensis]
MIMTSTLWQFYFKFSDNMDTKCRVFFNIFLCDMDHYYESDVFNKFKDSDGGFKKTISSDVEGLLSLYEATFLSVHGEDILDEALAFTRQRLETLAAQSSPRLAKRISNALLRPFHQGIERLEARQYICFYEGDESRNETLLKFAKLDYSRLQCLYKQKLAFLSRDRVVEAYLWAVGAHFEPEYALARLMIAKYAKMISVVDDTYDAYGTIDELRRFTDAFQRCDADVIDEVPEYMKVIYKGLLNLFDETESAGKEGMSYRTLMQRRR